MSLARRAFAYSIASQYLVTAVKFGSAIILARLLLPEEVGVYSVAAAFVAVAQVLREFGTGQYIVVEEELTGERIRSAFTVTLAIGWCLALLTFLSSEAAAEFYANPGVADVLNLIAFNFLILPFGTIPGALLRRNMNFRPVALAASGAAIVGATTTVACAYWGLSYMSMAWGNIAGALANIGIVSLFRPAGTPFLPGIRGIRHVTRFCIQSSTIDFLRQLSSSTADLIVGKTLGFHSAGLLSRSQGTMNMFNSILMNSVWSITTPFFAGIHRESREVRQPYVFLVTCVTGVAWPFYATIGVLSPYIVPTLFGPNWIEIIPLVQILCIGAFVYHYTSLAEKVLTATGRIDRTLRFTSTMTVIRIVLLATAAFFSLEAVIVVWSFLPFIRTALLWNDLTAATGLLKEHHVQILKKSLWPLAGAAFPALAIHYGNQLFPNPLSPFSLSFLGILVCFIGWVVALHWGGHPLSTELVSILNKVLKRKPAG